MRLFESDYKVKMYKSKYNKYCTCTDIILRVEHTNFKNKVKGKYEKHEKL